MRAASDVAISTTYRQESFRLLAPGMERSATRRGRNDEESAAALPAFDGERQAVTATHAERRDAATQPARLERIEQRRQNPCAAGTDRVSEGDGAPVHVDARRVETELVDHRDQLRGKR